MNKDTSYNNDMLYSMTDRVDYERDLIRVGEIGCLPVCSNILAYA